jgi:hypothetical protein
MSLTAQYITGGTIRSEAVSLKGTSFNLKGYFDYDYSPLLTFRALSGLETFNTKGETSGAQLICGDGTTTGCSVSFNYLSFEGHAQLNYLKGSTRAWVGIGYAFYVTMSKSINIPNLTASGSTNQAILVGTGADFKLSGGAYIPVLLEYGYIPGDNVKSSALFVRGGYGWDF